MRHVRTQLVGTAGDRLERKPGKALRRRLNHRVVSHRMAGAFLPMRCNTHERILFALLLGKKSRNSALARLWHARDQRPVDLACRTRAESFCERSGGKSCFRHQQAAGGVLIKPVHETGALAIR